MTSPTRRGSVLSSPHHLPGSLGGGASRRASGHLSAHSISWVCEATSTERRLLRGALEDRSLGLPAGVMAVLGCVQGDQVGVCGGWRRWSRFDR